MVMIIDHNFIESIKKVKEFAEKNPLYLNDILDMINGEKPMAGNTEGYYFIDQFGTKIVCTIEILQEYKLRHFSISMNHGKIMPNPFLVVAIMDILGFKNSLPDCIIEIERRESDPTVAILNVAEKILD